MPSPIAPTFQCRCYWLSHEHRRFILRERNDLDEYFDKINGTNKDFDFEVGDSFIKFNYLNIFIYFTLLLILNFFMY